MQYRVELKPRAEKDLKGMSPPDRERVVERLRMLGDGMRGDVKRLTNHVPEYRMRAGDWVPDRKVEEGKGTKGRASFLWRENV